MTTKEANVQGVLTVNARLDVTAFSLAAGDDGAPAGQRKLVGGEDAEDVNADLNEWLAAGWNVRSIAAAQGFVVLLIEKA